MVVNERIDVHQEYYELSRGIELLLEQKGILERKKVVIGICGESGSGKTITAYCLSGVLQNRDIVSAVINQDGYFYLPPRQNNMRRRGDISSVGPNEVNLALMQDHINAFKSQSSMIMVPVVDYAMNIIHDVRVDIQAAEILIVEGVYALLLESLDVRIFIDLDYNDTIEVRQSRSREAYDPYVERVLSIEHDLVKPLRETADIIITGSYEPVLNQRTESR